MEIFLNGKVREIKLLEKRMFLAKQFVFGIRRLFRSENSTP